MITIYAGVIDTDAETGERSVRNDLFVPVKIPAIVTDPQYDTWGSRYPFLYMPKWISYSYSTSTNNRLEDDATSMLTVIKALYPDTTFSLMLDILTANIEISFFLTESIESEMGFKLYAYSKGTNVDLYLQDKKRDLFLDPDTVVSSAEAFTDYSTFATSDGNKQWCFVIPYEYRDKTNFDEIIEDMINFQKVSWESDLFHLMPIMGKYRPFVFGPIHHRYYSGVDYYAYGQRGGNTPVGYNSYTMTACRNLNTCSNWYTFLFNHYIYEDANFVTNPKAPVVFELLEETNGIDRIEFSMPLLDSEYNDTHFDGGFENDVAFKNYAFREVVVGTDLLKLFDVSDASEQIVYLKNGAYIRMNEQSAYDGESVLPGCRVITFNADGKEYGFFSRINYAGFDPYNNNYAGFGLYILAPSTFAGIEPKNWLNSIDAEGPYEYDDCPVYLVSYMGLFVSDTNLPACYVPIYTVLWDYETHPYINAPAYISGFKDTNWLQLRINEHDNTADKDFWTLLLANIPSDLKPYNPGEGSQGGGYSGEGGGQGGYDDTDDGIGDHASPVDLSGMASFMLYAGDIGDIDSLIDYYSNPDYHITDDWRNKIQNAICSTKLYALPTGAHFKTGTDGGIKVGGWSIGDIHMKPVESQYVVMGTGTAETANMLLGTFKIEEYFGSFLDYAPYTKIQIYLPFVGVKDLDVNEIMGRECSLTCTIDLFTGNIVYKLSVENRHTAPGDYDKSVLYTFDGNVAIDIPLGQKDFADKVGMYINTCMSLGGLGLVGASVIATGGATAPLAVGSAMGSAMGTLAALGQQFHEISKASVPKSYIRNGNNTSNNGFSAPNVAFLMITRPKQNIPETFAHEYGFKSHISARLGDLTGFTKVEAIKLDGIPYLDQDELAELEEILKSGIIL